MTNAGPGDDLFSTPADIWVNTVNCVGPWGKGIALEFKRRFPFVHELYQRKLKAEGMQPGDVWLFPVTEVAKQAAWPRWVACVATKDHWRKPSELDWVLLGACRLQALIGDRVTAVPALGCGNGGLAWSEVRPLLEHYFQGTNVILFPPRRA